MTSLRLLAVCAVLALTGCAAGTPACTPATYVISPASAVLDHTATAPGNSQQFSESYVGGTCVRPLTVANGATVSSDPINAPSSPTGLISCVGATVVPVTITSGTAAPATLICK